MKPTGYLGASPQFGQERRDKGESRAGTGENASIRREAQPRKSIRRDPPPLDTALIQTDDQLQLRLGEELEYARRVLDQMGDALSSDANLLRRHGLTLQSIDIIGQILGHVAAVIRSSDPGGAVDHIGMSELKGRLTRTAIE